MTMLLTKSLRMFFEQAQFPSDKWDGYFSTYEKHLAKFVMIGRPITLVEVGVQKGGSLDMWGKYFPHKSRIIGIDIDPECAQLKYDNPNIEVVIGDQGEEKFWDDFLIKYPQPIDIFIDDGGHFMNQQILTFEKVFPRMPAGSVYICEDTHTSYMSYNGGGLHSRGSWIEYSKNYIDSLHKNWHSDLDTEQERKNKLSHGLASVSFYDSMVVFEKETDRRMQRVSKQ